MNFYTAGYQGRSADKFLQQIHELNALLVDIRFMPYSSVPGWSQAELVARARKHYAWIKPFGNENYKEKGNIKLYAPDEGLQRFEVLTRKFECAVLLCYCSSFETCHRCQVSAILEAHGHRRLGELPWPGRQGATLQRTLSLF